MLELYSEEFQPWIIFQQDGAPPHWGSHVRRFLDATFSIILENTWREIDYRLDVRRATKGTHIEAY
jgi:hypothetical protein